MPHPGIIFAACACCAALTFSACAPRSEAEPSAAASFPIEASSAAGVSIVETSADIAASDEDPAASIMEYEANESIPQPDRSGSSYSSAAPVSTLPETSDPEIISNGEKSGAEQEPIPELEVVVKRESLLGGVEKTITDEAQIRQVLMFVDGMVRSDYSSNPPTGGEIITVLITRNQSTEEYTFFDNQVEGGGLAKNNQDADVKNTWYLADAGAYTYLNSLL